LTEKKLAKSSPSDAEENLQSKLEKSKSTKTDKRPEEPSCFILPLVKEKAAKIVA
jgi:hypothetical protein